MLCSRCEQDKPENDFSFDPQNKRGRHGHCKKCRCQYAKGRRMAGLSPEELERERSHNRAWTASHRKECRRSVSEWARRNPDKIRDKKHRIRAMQHNCVRERIPRAMIEALWKFQDGRCAYCFSLSPLEAVTIDHVTPMSRGGSHTIDNIALACRPCNQSKGTKTASEFRAYRKATAHV